MIKERISLAVEESARPMTQNAVVFAARTDRNDATAWIKEMVRDGYLR